MTKNIISTASNFMRINIDQSACIECGTCKATCPKVFNLNEEGKSYVIEGADLSANFECIKEAVNICPVQAISIEA